MKFTIALSALASVASVCAESIYFVATSEDKSIDFPISSIHEGAGTNYFLGSSSGSGEVYDLEDGVASKPFGQYTSHVGVSYYLSSGPAVTPTKFTFDGDAINNYNFFACKDTNDPYNYSKKSYIILSTEKSSTAAPLDKCTAVTISKHAAGASTSTTLTSSSSSSSTASSTPTASLVEGGAGKVSSAAGLGLLGACALLI